VVEKQADYLFSLKGNSDLQSAETLYQNVQEYFEGLDFSLPVGKNNHIRFQSASTHEQEHRRIADRDHAVSEDVSWLIEGHAAWKSIRNIGVAESSR
jgi:hypothetical protein